MILKAIASKLIKWINRFDWMCALLSQFMFYCHIFVACSNPKISSVRTLIQLVSLSEKLHFNYSIYNLRISCRRNIYLWRCFSTMCYDQGSVLLVRNENKLLIDKKWYTLSCNWRRRVLFIKQTALYTGPLVETRNRTGTK